MNEAKETSPCVALTAGAYHDFTGMVMWGHTDCFVENADFKLKEEYVVYGEKALTLYGEKKMVVFLSGTFVDGVLGLCVWYDGTFRHGDSMYAIWRNGTWMDGTWENGEWIGGKWLGGTWIRGCCRQSARIGEYAPPVKDGLYGFTPGIVM